MSWETGEHDADASGRLAATATPDSAGDQASPVASRHVATGPAVTPADHRYPRCAEVTVTPVAVLPMWKGIAPRQAMYHEYKSPGLLRAKAETRIRTRPVQAVWYLIAIRKGWESAGAPT